MVESTQPEQSEAIIPTNEFYDQLGNKYEDAFGHDAGLHRILHRFLTYLAPTAPVLDCGCGTGKPVAQTIASTNRTLYGIDTAQTMIDLSSKQVPTGTFQNCNMLSYAPPTPAFFGGIVAMLSLFALSRAEITTMAQKWSQWIQPGGYLLIGTVAAEDCEIKPERWDADGECASRIEFTFMAQKVLITLFTKAGWKMLLEGVGFEIVFTETDFFRPPPEAQSDDELHYFVIARKKDRT